VRFGSLLGLVALLIALYILWQIQQVVLLGFAAVVFATVINRMVRRLQQGYLNRGMAIVISLTLLLSALAGFVAIVVPPFVQQIQQLAELVPQGLERLQSWATWLQELLPSQVIQDVRGLQAITQDLQSLVTQLFGNFFQFFRNSLGFILNFLLVLVVTIMLLGNPEAYRHIFILLFPSFYRRRVDVILQQSEEALVGWMKGILFNMAVITALSGLGLLVLNVQLPLANALLAGMLTFIPNLGPTLSVIPPAAIALLDAPWKALAVLILYIIIQQLESNFLTPIVMKRQVSLLPAITLLSQATFAIFFGILGLFLALPIIVVAQVWLREVLIHDVLDHWSRERDRPSNNGSDTTSDQHESTNQPAPEESIH
jgi:predicted PurR-regulated permease PerM